MFPKVTSCSPGSCPSWGASLGHPPCDSTPTLGWVHTPHPLTSTSHLVFSTVTENNKEKLGAEGEELEEAAEPPAVGEGTSQGHSWTLTGV